MDVLSYSDTSNVYVSASPGTNSAPAVETFETNFGIWTNSTLDDIDFTRQSGGTPSNGTGPSAASAGSFYIFTEASGGNNNSTAIISSTFDFSSDANPRLAFDYHMYGATMGSIVVRVNGNQIWSISGQQQTANADPWVPVSVNLDAYAGACYVLIEVEANTGSSFTSDIAIDNLGVPCAIEPGDASISSTALCAAGTVDLSLTGQDGAATIQWQQSTGGAYSDIAGATSPNYTTGTLTPGNTYSFRAKVTNGCDAFSDTNSVSVTSGGGTYPIPENNTLESGFGNWTNSTSDTHDWSTGSGGTPSNGTGPDAASSGAGYAFIESSNPYFNTTAILESDFDFTGYTAPELTFDYHMYGSDMGSLEVRY